MERSWVIMTCQDAGLQISPHNGSGKSKDVAELGTDKTGH